MDNGNETISISQYNEIVLSLFIVDEDDKKTYNKKLLPSNCVNRKYYYMKLNDNTGEKKTLEEKHKCSEDYLEYYWVEFMYNRKEYVVSLFHRDFDGQSGNIHVMPGVLQVWKKEENTWNATYMFPCVSGSKPYVQSVKQSDGKRYIWKPLIDYGKDALKMFVWAPSVDEKNISELFKTKHDCTILADILSKIKVKEQNQLLEKLKKYMKERENNNLINIVNCQKLSYGGPKNTKYKDLYRWTSTMVYNGDKYFICPYKHINTDYGYFIRFDGKPIAYKVKYNSGYPNQLVDCKDFIGKNYFIIKYDYANAADVINANKCFILKKNTAVSTGKLVKLDRQYNLLRVYKKADEKALHRYYSIRPDFDSSGYDIYEKETEFKCIYGRAESPTPVGVFDITNKSMPKEAYVSEYHPKYDKIKFFGYLEIFEDFFIHSDMYEESVAELPESNESSISNNDCDTSGCIRVSQEDLSWLFNNIEIGTPIIL